jgi:CRP/FNR family transcriptional regulator, cyclic AMP receptor protein
MAVTQSAPDQGELVLADKKLRARYLKILDRTPVFQHLPKKSRRSIADLAVVKRYEKDDVIVLEGDVGDSFHVILDGQVATSSSAGHEIVLGPGDCFGEISLIDGAPRSTTVVATGPVTIAVILREHFLTALHSEPELAVGLLPALTAVIRDLARTDPSLMAGHSHTGSWRSSSARGMNVADELTGPEAAEWLQLLHNVGIFTALDDQRLREIAWRFRIEKFKEGATIMVAGTPAESFHVVLKGRVLVRTPSGRSWELGEDDCFGELALIDGAHRYATAIAETDVVTAKLMRTEFRRMLKDEPAVAIGMAEGLVEIIRGMEKSLATSS